MIKGAKNSWRGGRMEGFSFNGKGIRKRAILNLPTLTRFTSALFNSGPHMSIFAEIGIHNHTVGE